MNADRESSRARRYLLGQTSEDERAAVEQEYFADERAVEHMEAVEEDLVEDYLAHRLGSDEQTLFERHYMTVPHRRRRVETVRALMSAAQPAAAPSASRSSTRVWVPLAVAASLILVLGGWWMLRSSPSVSDADHQQAVALSPPKPPTVAAPPVPEVFAFSVSPASMRSAGNSSTLVIPAGTHLVRFRLEGDPGSGRAAGARARGRTVTGQEVWQGATDVSPEIPDGVIAQIDVPEAHLPPNDYVIELFELDAKASSASASATSSPSALADHRRP